MNLVKVLFTEWENKKLEHVLSEIQNTLEEQLGSLTDDDNLDKVFYEWENNGNMWDSEVFQECMKLYSVLSTLSVPEHPFLSFLETAALLAASSELEAMERELKNEEIAYVEQYIDKINSVHYLRKLLIFIEKNNAWDMVTSIDMTDYRDGTISATDIEVKKALIANIKNPMRVIAVAGRADGNIAIEI
jgi:hypothetical protein